MIDTELKKRLITLAERYETVDFLNGDPSWFMHQVSGARNQEIMAFVASCLSYGNRKLFFPKIQYLLNRSEGNIHEWIKSGQYRDVIPDNNVCFYRLYTNHTMIVFFDALKDMLHEHDTIGKYVKTAGATDGLSAVAAITSFFAEKGIETIIPKDTTSACKRVCMFLRWMVRNNSPVDLGLWKDIIDKRTLIMPLDAHVMHEANRMKILTCKNPSMAVARKLTATMLEVFPDDPLKGDFALFGLGVDTPLCV